MHLKRLEIQGFKSFADKVEINFESGITAVVGPNGSGKSNISDSIRWVLGEQSAKTLRGSKMEDIIFSGTTSRKPLGMAEVSITLDNSSKTLPLDYGEVTITRRVYRSGESEYYINRSSCRLKDIRELLMDTGIGKEGYSIIGQGKIDEILSNKSEDRRQIFEEAAGIVKYKTRKDEAEKKLSSTKENLLRVLDILNELESQLGPLERQSNRAKEFKVLKERLLKLEVNLFIKEIDKIDEELKHINEQINLLKKSLAEQQKEKEFYNSKLENLEKEINGYALEISNKQDEYYNLQKLIEKTEGQINLKRERLHNNNLNIERIQVEMDEIKNIQANNTVKLGEKLADLENICLELDSTKEKLHRQSEEYNKLYQLSFQEEKNVENWKALIIEVMNEISDRKSEAKGLKTFISTMEERMLQVQEEYYKYGQQIIQKREDRNCLNTSLDQIEKHIEKTEEAILNKTDYKNKITEKMRTRYREVSEIQNKIRSKEARKSIIEDMEREYEGFNKSVKNILLACDKNKDLGKGVFGAVADLIQVPKGYEVAIETALSSSLQNIVTKDEEDGKRLIEYLKRHNLGRITILPLTTIQERTISKEELNIINGSKNVEMALNIVKFDKAFKNIFSNLLSRVLIVPNLDRGIEIARLLKYKFKIVTLDGDVLNIGGSLTGGSTSSKSTSILGRKRELEDLVKEIKVLKEELDRRTEEYDGLNKEVEENTAEIELLNLDLQENRIKVATLRNSVEQNMKELKLVENSQKHAEDEIRQIESAKKETMVRYERIEKEIKDLEFKIGSIESKVNLSQRELLERKQQLDQLSNILTEYKIQVATIEEQKKSLLQDIENLQESIKNNEDSLRTREDQFKESLESNLFYEGDIRKLEDQLNSLVSDLETYENKLRECKVNMEIQQAKEGEIKKVLRQVESVLGELQESIYKLDVKKTRLEMQQQGFYTKLWEEYELTYKDALSLKDEALDVSNYNKEIKILKDQIKALGSINLESIQEYEKVKERYDFLSRQQKDLSQAQESLVKVIKDMEETMEKQFVEYFKIIKENFNNVFIKLFGGGRADLILEDEGNVLQSGIEIIAQPPGKKLQSLSLLSGGERALTAIALLFAILLVKPSPFCVLDEIEAALDDANVYRYAGFLRELSKETQFIVVTHRKGTMESADALYGITMQDHGVSTVVSVKLTENQNDEIAS